MRRCVIDDQETQERNLRNMSNVPMCRRRAVPLAISVWKMDYVIPTLLTFPICSSGGGCTDRNWTKKGLERRLSVTFLYRTRWNGKVNLVSQHHFVFFFFGRVLDKKERLTLLFRRKSIIAQSRPTQESPIPASGAAVIEIPKSAAIFPILGNPSNCLVLKRMPEPEQHP